MSKNKMIPMREQCKWKGAISLPIVIAIGSPSLHLDTKFPTNKKTKNNSVAIVLDLLTFLIYFVNGQFHFELTASNCNAMIE